MKKKLFAILLALLLLSTTATVFAAAGEGVIEPRYVSYFSDVPPGGYTGAVTKTTPGVRAQLVLTSPSSTIWYAIVCQGTQEVSVQTDVLQLNQTTWISYLAGHGNAGTLYRANMICYSLTNKPRSAGTWDPG